MGLFKSKQNKIMEKVEKYIDERQLNELDPEDMSNIIRMLQRHIPRKPGNVNTTLSKSLREDAMLDFQEMISEQNWIIIKKLDEISKKLDK